MLNWIILTLCIALAGTIVWLGFRWRRRKSHDEDFTEPIDSDRLRRLGETLGLETYREMMLFGESLQVLEGRFDNLSVELESSRGDWESYVRIVVEFPSHLGQNLGICKDDEDALLNHLRRMREFEIGDETFDPKFLLFARDRDRLQRLLTDTTKFQLLRLAERSDRLRLTDDGLFLFMGRPCSHAEISSQLRKAIELGERIYRTAYILGPSIQGTEPSRYEEHPVDSIREAAGFESQDDSERRERRERSRD